MSTQAPTKKRVLIVANAMVAGGRDAFPVEIQNLMDETSEAFMIAPALTSRLEWLASDIDQANARAHARLQGILAQSSSVDHRVEGTIGDEDQLLAIADALTRFRADAIVLVVNAVSERNRKERQLIKHVEVRFGLPVTACSISTDGRVITI